MQTLNSLKNEKKVRIRVTNYTTINCKRDAY